MSDWQDDPDSIVFPRALSITGERRQYAAHVIPEAADGPAMRKIFALDHGDPRTATLLLIHADRSVTACQCHEPVIEGDLIRGLRPAVQAQATV